MRPVQFLAPILALSTLSAAWPSPESQEQSNGVNVVNPLYRRQDSSSADSKATESAKQSSNPSQTTQAPTGTDSKESTTTLSMKNTKSDSKTGTSTDSPSETEFDPRLPAGGIQMLDPAPTAPPSYYKIGDYVSFAWNYTSLSITPSYIDILASCSANQATYTLALNQSVGETGSVLWDTGAFQATATKQLLTESYTLIIYDAQSSISATAKPGYLAPNKQFVFGMYIPKGNTPWADWKCSSCNSAMTSSERQTLTVLFSMAAITVFSFTWFAGSFGVF